MSIIKKTIIGVFTLAVLSLPAYAQNQSFDNWLANFKNHARSRGISDATLQSAFASVKPSQRVIELDQKQPEKKGFDEYQRNVLTQQRINEGRRLLQENRSLLQQIQSNYCVQSQYVVALWGMETSYGKNTGGFDIITALATLAWEGRRREYFSGELLTALRILQNGHIDREDFKGSWAGAMGNVQFMPTSWEKFAVDYNGDGRKDIWTTKSDALASGANYLSKSDWVCGQKWGREVRLPAHFNSTLIGKNIRKPLSEWSRLGVRTSSGAPLPDDGSVNAFIVVPQGANGKAYLGYQNLANIMKWNNSSYFAISVGQLADAIASGKTIQTSNSSSSHPQAPAYHLND